MRVRLRAQGGAGGKPRVDRKGHGRINGLSIAKKGPALGHGFELDGKSLDLIAQQLAGGKGRWTHGDPCGDSLGQHLGGWENVRRSGEHVVGDFAFSALAKHVKPEGLSVDAPTYLMDMAEHEPDAAGLSVVVSLGEHEEMKDETGQVLVDDFGNRRLAARPVATPRADFVADPAANPDGLLAPSAALSEATALLDRAAAVHGKRNVRATLHAWLQATPEEESPMPCKTCGKTGADCACPKPEAEAPKADAAAAEMSAKLAKLEAESAANATRLAALNAENETLKKAAADRVAADDAAYVESLRTLSAEAQAPIDAAKLAKVVELQKAGHRDAARVVGDALLEAARAKNQTKAELRSANGVTTPAPGTGPTTGVAGAKALLEAGGFAVTLSQDGTQITSATKPTRK